MTPSFCNGRWHRRWPLEDVVDSLSQIDNSTVLTLCGNNEELRESMEERFSDNEKVRVCGFVRGMEYVYAASDAIVMKTGGVIHVGGPMHGAPLLFVWGDPGTGTEKQRLFA